MSELEKYEKAVILTDEIESAPIDPNNQFSFMDYSNAIISIINGSSQKCSIGIYGEWGTGKTTLMKLIEKKLKPTIFNWKDVPGQDNNKLKEYLIMNFDGVEWLKEKDIKFEKTGKTLTTLTISTSSHYVSIILNTEKGKANLEIDHTKVYEFAVEEDRIIENERVKNIDRQKFDNLSAEIQENNILTVWFNAWRYEKEEHLAVIPLIKTIAYAMGEHQFYYHIKPILLRGLEILSKDILRNLATRYLLTEKGIKEFEEKLIPKLERLPEIDKDTIYFDGIRKVEGEIQRIRRDFPQSRIVIFIDDLDRCSPETAVEVFESIKVFLDIEGFVFIVGLSRRLLNKMIEVKLEKAGLTGIQADEYIRKIIQIEINIPNWDNSSIEKLMSTLVKRLDNTHRQGITDSQDLILEVVEQNPRQTKRFINNFIIASSAKKLNTRVYFLRELLIRKWPDFYKSLNTDEIFRERIRRYANLTIPDRENQLEQEKQKYKDNIPENIKKLLELDKSLWHFLDKKENKQSFSEIIDQWRTYESIAQSVKSPLDAEVMVSMTAHEPDLSLFIIERQPQKLEYEVFMSATKNPLTSVGIISLNYNTQTNFVTNLFRDIEDDSKLPTMGMSLYDEIFPSELKQIYWQIHNQIKSIRVISSEPWIPWEIIKPWRKLDDGKVEEDEFLCERYAFSRWIEGESENIKERVRKVKVIAPLDSRLPFVRTQRDWIQEFGNRIGLDVSFDSTYAEVIKTLETGGFDLLQFLVPAHYNNDILSSSSLEVGNGAKLKPVAINGRAQNFGQSHPLVILNLSQTGAQGILPTGIPAWAVKFIGAGASALIGPLWSVSDENAFRFVQELYQQLSTGTVSLGEAVRRARIRCKQIGDPSWLSYQLYGHPNAIIKIGI